MNLSTLTTPLCCLVLLTPGRFSLIADNINAGLDPGTATEPIRIIATAIPDMKYHDAALPPVVGAQNIQVMRANRTHPDADGADGLGWTYNHAPMLCYWKGRFYLEYLTDPVGEHIPPGQTMLTESTDGFQWSKPRVAFPPFKPDGEKQWTVSHQRMGFYVAPDGRLLVLSFYGRAPRPNDGTGIGRAVREIHEDGTFGPIYVIRYNHRTETGEEKMPHPIYTNATDKGFVAACNALLGNKLMTQQWWEEDRAKDGFFSLSGRDKGFDAKAFSFYHRKDGTVVGLWKKRWAALSMDEGKSWTEPVQIPTLVTGGAKTWGQRTDDGRFALAFDPHTSSRWPLVVVTGEDGITFDRMQVVHGEIPYPRYDGQYKSMGPQYVRGIVEGNGNPPGQCMWLTYSVNKEDIWVTCLPLPIQDTVKEPVEDNFDNLALGLPVSGWNIYSPIWAPVTVAASPDGESGHCLSLQDEDLYDYAKAVRVFPAAKQFTTGLRLWIDQSSGNALDIELLDRAGKRPIRLRADEEGLWFQQEDSSPNQAVKLASLSKGEWVRIEVQVDTALQHFNLKMNGSTILEDAVFAEPVEKPLERLCFRTGPVRDYDAHQADLLIDESKLGDRLQGDLKQPLLRVYVDDVKIETH